jgi:hypothetical protein
MIRAMGNRPRNPPLLDEQHAAFIQGGVSVIVATRNTELVPDAVRGCGCRVSKDRRSVTVLIDPGRAGSVIEDIGSNRMIAVVFSQPSTHRTIQLKGTDARLVRISPGDRALAVKHLAAWVEDLCSVGYRPEFARVLHGEAPRAMVAVAFTPTSAFQQTPGPGAGERLPG